MARVIPPASHDIDQQRAAIERLQRRVDARRGKPGVGEHIALLKQAKHALLSMELAEAQARFAEVNRRDQAR